MIDRINRTTRKEMAQKIKIGRKIFYVDYERFLKLAKNMLEVDVSMITLREQEEQWFCTDRRTAIKQKPTVKTISDYVQRKAGLVEINDLRNDSRIEGPIFVDEQQLNHYAAVPLKIKDMVLGTLAILDREPGNLTNLSGEKKDILQILAERFTEQFC